VNLILTLQTHEHFRESRGMLSSEPSSDTGGIFMQCYSLFGAVHTNSFIVLLFCVETSYQKLHYFPSRRFHNNYKQSVVLIRHTTYNL
jgi:hypothetical protein